jgi:hypothetical protein
VRWLVLGWTFAGMVCLTLAVHGRLAAEGKLRLPSIFGDHMVLQCNMPVPVWGWAEPNEEVAVILKGKLHRAQKRTPTVAGWSNFRLSLLVVRMS